MDKPEVYARQLAGRKMSFGISGMRIFSPEYSVTVPLIAKSLEFNFQSSFQEDSSIPGARFTIETGIGASTSPTRIKYVAIQVTIFDYYTYADVQNQNQPYSTEENAQDIVNVNLDTNLVYFYNSVFYSITSFRIRTECKLLNKNFILNLKKFFLFFLVCLHL